MQPPLEDGEVHLWTADLSEVDGKLCAFLSGDEQARVEDIHDGSRRDRWARGRALLRVLLGGYLASEPGELHFTLSARGKPALAPGSGELEFNMSHSADVALYAFSRAGPVGVDVEVPRRQIDEIAIAAQVFGVEEASRLSKLDRAERRRSFLSSWTRHEAQLKCLGVGLGTPRPADAPALWTTAIEVGGEAQAALALARRPSALERWRWRGPGEAQTGAL